MPSAKGSQIFAPFAWINGKIEENVLLSVDNNGTITDIKINYEPETLSTDILILKDEVLFPGFVNSHSHAFHRHLRGRSEIGRGTAETFWKWRDNMYGLVDGITKEGIYKYCLTTFKEMVKAGITTVGEFHYVHHGDGRFDLDEEVIRAAKDAGIRIVLLQTLYERAGFDSPPLHPVQKRFTSDYEEFVKHLEKLRNLTGDTVTIGVAAHSTRAVNFEDITKLYKYAMEQRIPFHIHLEEQPKEIQDCKAVHNMGPSDALLSMLEIGPGFTAVHSTYTPKTNMEKFAKQNANVSLCPCTEGYLGDGIPHLPENLDVSFGTDCNNRICLVEEMRWACYSQQMLHNSRSIAGLTAEKLLQCATLGGAKALGLEKVVGSFEIGKQFDAVTFDLSSELLDSWEKLTLIDAIVFGCGNREITHVFVNGEKRFVRKS